MFCENCGSSLPENSKFCATCGVKVDAPPAPQRGPVFTPPPPPPPPPPAYEQAGGTVSPPPSDPGPAVQTEPPPAAVPAPAAPPVQAQQHPSPPRSYGPQPQSAPLPRAQPTGAPLSVGQYIGMFLLLAVPLLNIILLFVWSFGSSAGPNKRNFARAALILFAISVVITAISGGAIFRALEAILESF